MSFLDHGENKLLEGKEKSSFAFLKAVTIQSQKYGKIITFLSNENRIGNTYFVFEKKKDSLLSGLVDEEGKEIIPLDEMILKELFFTEDFQEICFGFALPNQSYLKYFHVTSEQGTYRIFLTTDPTSEKPLLINKMEEDSLWLLEQANSSVLENKYAFYSPREHKMITPFFSELRLLEKNENHHFAYFCSNVFTRRKVENNWEEVFHTSICGYLNQEGDFSSQLFNTKDKKLYNSYLFDGNPTSLKYREFLEGLQVKYYQELLQTEQFIKETLNYLGTNPNLSWDSPKTRKKTAKILKFPTKQES